DKLLGAFRTLRQKHTNLKLLVAGATPDNTDYLGTLHEELSEEEMASIVIGDRFLDPAEISLCLRAGDIAVLPYREALTSGSAILALSFGCPVILPDTVALRHLTHEGKTGWLFNPDNEKQTLEAVIAKALSESRNPVTRARRRQAAETFAQSQAWQDFNAVVTAALNAPRSG
ncbi:MAG: glycosyltransferase, partial [Pseudomonadota bacterium]